MIADLFDAPSVFELVVLALHGAICIGLCATILWRPTVKILFATGYYAVVCFGGVAIRGVLAENYALTAISGAATLVACALIVHMRRLFRAVEIRGTAHEPPPEREE